MDSLKKTLITIVGPTAIGKTSLSILIASYFNTEVISCDSRQFYKEMTIGTAVPEKEELATVPHHFIQNRSIVEDYNVGAFEKEVVKDGGRNAIQINISGVGTAEVSTPDIIEGEIINDS